MANRVKVSNINHISLLRYQTQKGGIERFFKNTFFMEVCKESQNIPLKHTPTFLEEGHGKAIRARSLITLSFPKSRNNLLLKLPF